MNKYQTGNFDAICAEAVERVQAASSVTDYKLNLGALLTYAVFPLKKWDLVPPRVVVRIK